MTIPTMTIPTMTIPTTTLDRDPDDELAIDLDDEDPTDPTPREAEWAPPDAQPSRPPRHPVG